MHLSWSAPSAMAGVPVSNVVLELSTHPSSAPTKDVVQDAERGVDGGDGAPIAGICSYKLKGECRITREGRAFVLQGAELGPDLGSVHSVVGRCTHSGGAATSTAPARTPVHV